MRSLFIITAALFIQACTGGGGDSSENGMTDTKMTAEIGGESYEVDVRYYLDDQSGLTVYSDQDDVTDSNGDGLIFAIFEFNEKLQFDFVKDGDRMGGRISDWKKSETEITGQGTLRPEGEFGQGTPVSFTLKL